MNADAAFLLQLTINGFLDAGEASRILRRPDRFVFAVRARGFDYEAVRTPDGSFELQALLFPPPELAGSKGAAMRPFALAE